MQNKMLLVTVRCFSFLNYRLREPTLLLATSFLSCVTDIQYAKLSPLEGRRLCYRLGLTSLTQNFDKWKLPRLSSASLSFFFLRTA